MSSVESELSNDAYVKLINDNWGDEEGELRQAIYFQFIKKDVFSHQIDEMDFES